MKVTMYELLGLVKDGKAPKKIKYDYHYYIYDENDNTYYQEISGGNKLRITINELNEEVEILEEEKKIPEKSNIDFNTKLPVSGCSENEAFMMTCISHLGKTIDSLIDYFKSKGDE